MAKPSRSPKTPKNKNSVRNSRATVSGPAKPDASSAGDLAAEKAAGAQEIASAFPFSLIKAAEYDPDAALAPPQGASVEPADPIVGAILALDEGLQLLEASPTLPGGESDPGLIATSSDARTTTDAFVATIARHRHFARETDPPRV